MQVFDAHNDAKRSLSLWMIAALLVKPLAAALSEKELKHAATQLGMSPAIFDEVIVDFCSDREIPPSGEISANYIDWGRLRGHGFPPAVPMHAIAQVATAILKLGAEHGVSTGLPFELIVSASGQSPHDSGVALEFLLGHRAIERTPGGFRKRLLVATGFGANDPNHPAVETLRGMCAIVDSIFAARTGTAAPSTPPLERFYLFLQKQGWGGLAGWWAGTITEFRSLSKHSPTAMTVLAGALLEAALVSIAEP